MIESGFRQSLPRREGSGADNEQGAGFVGLLCLPVPEP
jgi:hypothetical protein